jgi:hypothetical protein
VTSKRPGSSPPAGGGESISPSTLRSIEVAEPVTPADESPAVPVYYEPQPLIAVSDHKTIEVDTVKLAEDIDPRKLPTELRLARPISVAPPDSGWPQSDVVVVSSQPPAARGRRLRVSAVLLTLLGALLILLLARGAVRRTHAAVQTANSPAPSAAPINAGPAPALSAEPAPPLVAPLAAPLAVSAETEPSAAPNGEVAPAVSAPRAVGHAPHRALKTNSHSKLEPAPSASSPVLSVPSVSKPKRAIY